ncbi:DNA-O6-methylguanine--protein-cysteine S-methyltransferase /transcriptional regulator Ada [Yoonia maricola]|uniref:methylated-DNA--[protein]-cysteine S-methyltransferase n=2 Tax=Yoonia maricola TaxID=420999 RepID=A0A2M8WL34_9RHOB|nr:DNA-O6-methylguanine--protein-cysteine S-methyltransferase /transcriptional regulator Ada [Yoonia maricola]
MFDLPNDDTLYDALLARDATYDGRAYVGVSSTGIFCRLTCPARKPKRENCRFYADVASCISAGFRPCKRCHPLDPAAQSDPTIGKLLAALDARPAYRWSEPDVMRMGLDSSTVRRAFKRHFGRTFLEMARSRRLASGFTALSAGSVIDAQLDAGFDSPSAFRAAFAKLMGAAPGTLSRDALLRADHLKTPLGDMIAVCDKRALHLLEFADRKALPTEMQKLRKAAKGSVGIGRFETHDQIASELDAFFAKRCDSFTTSLALHGTAFTREVWKTLQTIPAGETRSYSAIAASMGAPQSIRAVARANGANQIAIVIPCHRVIGADGSLTGYGGGLWRKQQIIDLERHHAKRRLP